MLPTQKTSINAPLHHGQTLTGIGNWLRRESLSEIRFHRLFLLSSLMTERKTRSRSVEWPDPLFGYLRIYSSGANSLTKLRKPVDLGTPLEICEQACFGPTNVISFPVPANPSSKATQS